MPQRPMEPRMDFKIRVTTIRVFRDGVQLGIMSTHDARKIAQEAGLNLVELVPNAKPPVCHIMDYGEYKYKKSIQDKETRKKQRQSQLQEKELQLRPAIDEHDIQTKCRHARTFLEEGRKIHLVLRMRGRELSHKDMGFQVVNRVIELLADVAVVESPPRMDGKTIMCRLTPFKKEK